MIATAAALGIGAALGAAKYASDVESADRQRQLQGAITRYSPWTGMHGQPVQDPNAFGDILQGGAAGGMMNGIGAPAAGAAGAGAGAEGAAASTAASTGMGSQLGVNAANFHLLDPSAMGGMDPAGSMSQLSSSPWMNMNMNNYSLGSPNLMAGR